LTKLQLHKLVARLQNADTRKAAFRELVEQYSEPLYWKIRHIVTFHDDADDVLQNTFIKVWQNIDSFRNESELSTWLYRIAINEAISFVRKRKVAFVSMDDDNSYAEAFANKLQGDIFFDQDEAELLLQRAIASLPDVQRTVFTLKYYDEMKYSEMSRVLDTSEGALKASYHLATIKIKQYIETHR